MNNLKKKLFAATAMLLVSAVMLGSSTFAWYTLSTAPEITAVKFNMAANQNLEIALDNGYTIGEGADVTTSVDYASNNSSAGGVQGSTNGNPYTWGNLVDLKYAINQISTGDPAVSKIALKPVKFYPGNITSGQPGFVDNAAYGELVYPKYGEDGRIKEMAELNKINQSALENVTGNSLKGGFAVYGQKTDADAANQNSTYDAFSVTYWLRTNEGTDSDKITVKLSENGVLRAKSDEDSTAATGTDKTDPNLDEGLGSFITSTSTTNKAEENKKLYKLIKEGKLVIRFEKMEASATDSFASGSLVGFAHVVAADDTSVSDGVKLKLMDKQPGTATPYANATITLDPNKGQKIRTYVYLDGEKITNADALLSDLEGIQLNLQFVDNKGTDGGQKIQDAMDAASAV